MSLDDTVVTVRLVVRPAADAPAAAADAAQNVESSIRVTPGDVLVVTKAHVDRFEGYLESNSAISGVFPTSFADRHDICLVKDTEMTIGEVRQAWRARDLRGNKSLVRSGNKWVFLSEFVLAWGLSPRRERSFVPLSLMAFDEVTEDIEMNDLEETFGML